MMLHHRFEGFPQAGLDFLRELEQNNTREWFEPRKAEFNRTLRDPALAFIAELGARLQTIAPDIRVDLRTNGGGSLMRFNRDTRFSANKAPYKIELPMLWWEGPGKKMQHPAFGMRVRPVGVGLMAGMFGFEAALLAAYREAVDHDKLGPELAALVADVRGQGYIIEGEHYKRVPRGFAADHPRADLLRHNALYAALADDIPPAIVTTPELVEVCFEHCRAMAPVQQWLVKIARRADLQ